MNENTTGIERVDSETKYDMNHNYVHDLSALPHC